MPTIRTTGWSVELKPELKQLSLPGFSIPVYVKNFIHPHEGYCVVYPQARLAGGDWAAWLDICKRLACYDVAQKYWVWTRLALSKITSDHTIPYQPPVTLTDAQRLDLRARREAANAKFASDLLELTKQENVPEDLWPTFQYPSHLKPVDPQPTALQRIVVSRYWNHPFCLIGASVGTGKSRMTVDMLTARATAPTLRDTVRIVLIVAPLSLHTNWAREFSKWTSAQVAPCSNESSAEWHIHRYAPTVKFWNAANQSAHELFGTAGEERAGGLVIIVTPNTLSRAKFTDQMATNGCHPTCIVVDEVQRFFRRPDNSAFRNLLKLRSAASTFIGLSGTPTSKFQDWWALEELMGNSDGAVHWKRGTYLDYEHLGSPDTMAQSGLFETGWNFERAIKEFHADRIRKGHIFMADKHYYMKDALPGIGQEELGEFADLRLSFFNVFNDYPEWVDAAMELQQQCNDTAMKGGAHVIAQVLLLRMRQLAATSTETASILASFVTDYLGDDEPASFWVEFRNEPCPELDNTVKYLSAIAPTCWLGGGMTEAERQEAIDGFQSGKYRFIVCQTEAAGVGLTLTRACKQLFLTIPLGYLAVTQAIGRHHRLGQTRDVTSYFAMTGPAAAFARAIYDRRQELNEVIPQKISGILPKQIIDIVGAVSQDA